MFPFLCEGSHWKWPGCSEGCPVEVCQGKGAGSGTVSPCLSCQSLSRAACPPGRDIQEPEPGHCLHCGWMSQQNSAEEVSMPLCLGDVSESSSLPFPCKTPSCSLGSVSDWVQGHHLGSSDGSVPLWGKHCVQTKHKPEETWEGSCSRTF